MLSFIPGFKLFRFIFISTLLLIIGFVAYSNYTIIKQNTDKMFEEVSLIPEKKVGLLLGAKPGNNYYIRRIKAAVELYKAGKIKKILVSGDNHVKSYDEASAMKNDLMEAGVAEKDIILDYAGFRTLDSVIRCAEIFGQNSFTIISQPFHNQRALYIAESLGYQCVAYNAEDVNVNGWGTQWREILARAKCVLDIHILHSQPKFLGEKIDIPA